MPRRPPETFHSDLHLARWRRVRWPLAVGTGLLLAGCTLLDPNSEPTYGKTGLPKNCRAIVQANIDGYRSKQFSADEVMNSLERNCGANGYSWGR